MWNDKAVGSHQHRKADRCSVRCAVITVSDTRGESDDGSGTLIRERLEGAGHVVAYYAIVADEPDLVAAEVRRLAAGEDVEAVILNGGTGVAPRDNTYEALCSLLDKRIDGFGELFRMLSWEEVGAMAMISRAVAGLAGSTVVFSLPGSTAACRLGMERLILPSLGHLVGLAAPRE